MNLKIFSALNTFTAPAFDGTGLQRLVGPQEPAGEPVRTVRRQRQGRGKMGYSLGDVEIEGRALLGRANMGVDLVMRLKDTLPEAEIEFWAKQLAHLAPADMTFDLVTHAPSSGKRPPDRHLATIMARIVAKELGIAFGSVFVNEHPRGNRGSRAAKLEELTQNPYIYTGPPGARLLVIDDVVFTRSTVKRCANAAGSRCYFLVLYRG